MCLWNQKVQQSAVLLLSSKYNQRDFQVLMSYLGQGLQLCKDWLITNQSSLLLK